ncbi:MAG TPA: class I SAM-dependent methyltransferase, partial [Pyrinomonadaceae bacterium]|nr:class I SAM-dependent methyltransferase [Pyrinomonadaceae bacterium]
STQFAYFNEQFDHLDWRRKTVFDFGGNKGNLLRDPSCSIRQQDYYCLDVLRDAIEVGREDFPDAHWIHYNRYNRSFNPEGVTDLPVPDLGVRFDFILAYSVFTHTTLEEMKDLVSQLEAFLAPGGTLAFTFIDPHWRPWSGAYDGNNLRWRLEQSHAPDIDRLIEESRDADWCSLVNGTELYVNSNGSWTISPETCATYNVFYSENFLQEQFPSARIRRPISGEMQHCAILRKD